MIPGTLQSHPGHAPAPNHHLSTAPDLITEGQVKEADVGSDASLGFCLAESRTCSTGCLKHLDSEC